MSSYYTCPEDTSTCTFATCAKECAQVEYVPTLGGNLAFLIVFAFILLFQIGLGAWYRTWGFLFGMVFGLALEIIGYIGRLMLHSNPFDSDAFLIYLVCLTIGPAFLTASIYLCLSRIIIVNGQSLSRISPRILSLMFMVFDFIALLLQAIGGAIASSADTVSTSNVGRNIMIAGLAWQVVSLAIFMLIWADYIWKLSKAGDERRNQNFRDLWLGTKRFRWFQYALWAATILIFIRSIYRVVELQGGFNGAIANNEAAFMVFEGPMIILATGALTVLHPGYAFAGRWHEAVWSLRGRRSELSKNPSYENVPLETNFTSYAHLQEQEDDALMRSVVTHNRSAY